MDVVLIYLFRILSPITSSLLLVWGYPKPPVGSVFVIHGMASGGLIVREMVWRNDSFPAVSHPECFCAWVNLQFHASWLWMIWVVSQWVRDEFGNWLVPTPVHPFDSIPVALTCPPQKSRLRPGRGGAGGLRRCLIRGSISSPTKTCFWKGKRGSKGNIKQWWLFLPSVCLLSLSHMSAPPCGDRHETFRLSPHGWSMKRFIPW